MKNLYGHCGSNTADINDATLCFCQMWSGQSSQLDNAENKNIYINLIIWKKFLLACAHSQQTNNQKSQEIDGLPHPIFVQFLHCSPITKF